MGAGAILRRTAIPEGANRDLTLNKEALPGIECREKLGSLQCSHAG